MAFVYQRVVEKVGKQNKKKEKKGRGGEGRREHFLKSGESFFLLLC